MRELTLKHPILERAESFIWHNGRLLERQLFAYRFKNQKPKNVINALLAYQNDDGGFGNALEPDIRCPDSQPVPCQVALEILDEVGFDEAIVTRICDYLLTITTAEGGVPWVLPSVMNYPRAPWWRSEENPPASINPTAIICAVLHKNRFQHTWLEGATEFCWRYIEGDLPEEMHDTGSVLSFLRHVLDRERAEKQFERQVQYLLDSGLVADAGTDGYVWKPLDWAPFPDDPLRKYFSQAKVEAHFEEILAGQQEDGGWTIPWEAISPGCNLEWRGWVTVGRLHILYKNGRLGLQAPYIYTWVKF